MSKYYTPTIEEFHVGFEYERCDDGYDWIKDSYPRAAEHIKLENLILYTRVKYLDREDIESLGFRTNEMTTPISFESDFYEKKHKGILRVCLVENEHFVYVKKMYKKDVKTIFSGTIKNKSELKKLLKQLGV